MNVELRPITIDRANTKYLGWLNDPEITEHLDTVTQPYTMQQLRDFIGGMMASPVDRFYAILAAGFFVGTFRVGPRTDDTAWTGVMIGDRDLWGKGIATAAHLEAARIWGPRSGVSPLQMLVGAANVKNIGAIRSMEKAGYRFRGYTEPPESKYPAVVLERRLR